MLEEENQMNQQIDLAVNQVANLARQGNNLPFKEFLRNQFLQQIGNPHFVQALPSLTDEGYLRRTGPWDMPSKANNLFFMFEQERDKKRRHQPY